MKEAWACSRLGLAPRITTVDTKRIPSQTAQSTYLAAFVVSPSRSRRRNEAIPDSRFGNDQLRIGRVPLDLAAQVRHVHAEIEPRVAECPLPHSGEQLVMGENPPRIGDEHREQLPLDRSEPN